MVRASVGDLGHEAGALPDLHSVTAHPIVDFHPSNEGPLPARHRHGKGQPNGAAANSIAAEILGLSAVPMQRPLRLADSCSAAKFLSFGHLVGAGERRRRDVEAERLRGFGVIARSNFLGSRTGKPAGLGTFAVSAY